MKTTSSFILCIKGKEILVSRHPVICLFIFYDLEGRHLDIYILLKEHAQFKLGQSSEFL